MICLLRLLLLLILILCLQRYKMTEWLLEIAITDTIIIWVATKSGIGHGLGHGVGYGVGHGYPWSIF